MTRRALVTGGAHPIGIGFAAAQSLVRDGYDVVVTGISADETAQTPKIAGISTAILDVRDESAVRALAAGFDRLDALVNCAGATNHEEFTAEGFARTLDINLTGTLRACIAATDKLAATQGAIVNIASMYATFGSGSVPGYSASKGGVVQLTKSLAVAWGKTGVRVNAIAPGWIKTGLAQPLWGNPDLADPISERTPMGRWGEPAECGDVIAFLCSPAARFVTGQTIAVDGGYLASG